MRIKKLHLFYVSLFILAVILALFVFSSSAFASGPNASLDGGASGVATEYTPENENILLRLLGGAFGLIANLIYAVLGDASIDSLVFNQGGGLSGLSLFKPGATQEFLAKFYKLFNYIAIAFFIPIVYYTIIAFTKAGDNPQGKSILKDKLMRIVLTFAFLYTMPEILTLLVKISNAFVDIFFGVGGGMTNPVGGYIKSSLAMAEGSAFINGITALMLIGINIWMIFFYIIRDLTIAFLFMFFPIVAIWFPLKSEMVISWWKNMASNVLAQPIQAVILSLVLTMTRGINVAEVNFLDGLYMIVAFGAIIPMTGIIKGFLGLEGNVGAASSRAGMGGMIAAVSMFRMASNSVSKNKELIKEGLNEKADVIAEKRADKKNIDRENVSSPSDVERPLINPNAKMPQDLREKNRESNKKIARGLSAVGHGAFTGMVGASIGGGLGGRSAMVGGLAGYGIGSITGGFAGENLADRASGIEMNRLDDVEIKNLQLQAVRDLYENEKLTDAQAQEIIDTNPEINEKTYNIAQDKLLGIYNKKLSNTEFQKAERNARMAQRRINNKGSSLAYSHMARKKYLDGAMNRKSDDEILRISQDEGSNLNLYQDKDISYIYSNTENGIEVLKTGPGISGMNTVFDSPISFNPQDIKEMSLDYSMDYEEKAHASAMSYMASTHANVSMDSSEYQPLYKERYNEVLRDYKKNHSNYINQSRSLLGFEHMGTMTNQDKLNELQHIRKERITLQAYELKQAQINTANKKKAEVNQEDVFGLSL